MKKMLLTISLVALGVISVSAQAGKGGGKAHPEKLACEMLKADDVTKGLYGLCVKYCKVKDFSKYSDEKARKKEAKYNEKKEKYMAKYKEKMKPGDPEMPCLESYDTATSPTVDSLVCPCFNTSVCEATMADGDSCDILNVESVAELYPQQSCNLLDMCRNTSTSATDVCANLSSSSGVTVNVYEGLGYGECSATVDGARNAIQNLDLETAQRCLDELNQFDPDNDTFDSMACGLASTP